MALSRIKILLLFAQITDKLSYYDDWKDAFISSQEFETTSVNILEKINVKAVDKTIRDYDLVVLLHSTNGGGVSNIAPYKDALIKRKGKLLVFVGNEVNIAHISMKEKIDFIRDIDAEFIGTQLLLEAGRWLFEDCRNSTVVPLPPALNPDAFKPIIPQEKRKIDIGVRSNKYPPHMGDDERNELFRFFLNKTFRSTLYVDISTAARFNRSGWADFLNSCKATIANEAGTYYLERDDKTVKEVQKFIEEKAKKNKLYIAADYHALPFWWRLFPIGLRKRIKDMVRPFIISKRESYDSISFSEVFEVFFKNYKRPPFYSKCISSRHFDAIGTKTCQIMFEGRFNDILKADEHYIALRRDFSNIDDVMRRFQDISYRKAIADHTYNYIMETHTYAHRLKTIMDLLL